MKNRTIFLMIAATGTVCCLILSCAKGYYRAGEMEYLRDNFAGYTAQADGQMPQEPPQDPGAGDRFDEIVENPFVAVSDEPQSTFSVDADGASYAYMRRFVKGGNLPQANAVRIEEFLNYFTFDYPDPADGGDIALNAETAACPWNPEHQLLRLGIKGKSIPAGEEPQANFVFLIDISGSMDYSDKLPVLKAGLIRMLEQMRSTDRVAIVTYASGEDLLLPSTPVSSKNKIVNAIKQLSARGSTAGAQAMKMAYEEATRNFIEGANNRIIMGTDGDFNVGVTSTEALKEMVENYASRGIYLTICGFGTGNLNDAMMESVSNSGNGTYHYIDSEEEMLKVFVYERERFVAVANDCKVQVTFNPAAVEKYRLIGYENRVMASEDFENDKKDAAEIGSGQTITALYEIIPAEGAAADTSPAKFDFRYKKALGGESIPLTLTAPALTATPSENFRFAASLAAFGLTLRSSEYRGSASIDLARELAGNAGTYDPDGFRKEYRDLLAKAAALQRQ